MLARMGKELSKKFLPSIPSHFPDRVILPPLNTLPFIRKMPVLDGTSLVRERFLQGFFFSEEIESKSVERLLKSFLSFLSRLKGRPRMKRCWNLVENSALKLIEISRGEEGGRAWIVVSRRIFVSYCKIKSLPPPPPGKIRASPPRSFLPLSLPFHPRFPLLLLLLFALPFLARRIGTKADVKLGKLNETTAREGATFRRRGGVSRKFSTYLLHEPYTSKRICVYIYISVCIYIYIEREKKRGPREGWKNAGERSPPLPRGFITEDEVPKRPSFTRSRDRCTTRFFSPTFRSSESRFERFESDPLILYFSCR